MADIRTRRFRTLVACRWIGVPRERFNEAVAAKLYPCAPATGAGQARILEYADLIGMDAFFRFSRMGFSQEVAGNLACELVDMVRRHPDDDRFVIVWGAYGDTHVFRSIEDDPEGGYDHDHERKLNRIYHGLSPIIDAIDHRVRPVRERFQKLMDDEDNIVGGADLDTE